MRRWMSVLLASGVLGCSPHAPGGGGGTPSLAQLKATRGELADAYRDAAAAHAEVIRDDYPQATQALRRVRSDLGAAKQQARPEVRIRIERLEVGLAEAERAVGNRSVQSYARTAKLVDQTHALLITVGPMGLPSPSAS